MSQVDKRRNAKVELGREDARRDSGIGRAVAIAYAREGADVAIGYLPSEQSDADEVARLVREAGRTSNLPSLPIINDDVKPEDYLGRLPGDPGDGTYAGAPHPDSNDRVKL